MKKGTIHRFQPKRYYYTFGPNAPALRVEDGDTVVAPTRDARGFGSDMEPLREDQKQRSGDTEYRESNPLVGPIYVEGAEVGDALAVHIEKIALNRPLAWSYLMPNFGSMTGEGPGKALFLNEPLPEIRYGWGLDLERQVGTLKLQRSRIPEAPRSGRVEMALTPV